MVDLKQKLINWSESFLEGSGEFLVEVENKSGSSVYRVYIDGITPISVMRCADLSRHLSKLIDEDDTLGDADHFTMEVSSPGADRPLRLPGQYHKHTGRSLKVITTEGEEISGVLKGVNDDSVTLEVRISKKETIEQVIEFKRIKEAYVIISFKEVKR